MILGGGTKCKFCNFSNFNWLLITLNSPATLDVNGDANFTQNVKFAPTSAVELNGTTIANGPCRVLRFSSDSSSQLNLQTQVKSSQMHIPISMQIWKSMQIWMSLEM